MNSMDEHAFTQKLLLGSLHKVINGTLAELSSMEELNSMEKDMSN